MKVYIAAFSLILPFAHGIEFPSAIAYNVCKKYDAGWGWGRVSYKTRSARCLSEKKMHLLCLETHPTQDDRAGDHFCEGDTTCIPHNYVLGQSPDAGCIRLWSPSGVKGDGDLDNYSCSSGITIGNDDIWVLSSVTPDSILYKDGIRTCIVSKSGSSSPVDRVYSQSPCPQTSTVLKLSKHTTYQACIFTLLKLAKKSVGFTWHLRGPGKLPRNRRGLGLQGQPLSELFTIVSNNTANDAVKIVIGD
ncbi:hypothetical protein EG328_005372 [Venturia inaequalis]|uniref:Uncharacterized protein n=1 Tax=Venturia inaequalis TaxID=5025 RepID=A0A8H3UNA6_VENIN|nr:hypothetical protein EG328_005372 [Venturia inaequalis]RDI77113.1 hypothetical protein Vi05172_g12910 [Venturia inaequalis]